MLVHDSPNTHLNTTFVVNLKAALESTKRKYV